MKMKTEYTVTLSQEEVLKLLTKFVEKKTSKKVVDVNLDAAVDAAGHSFTFKLQGEENDMEQKEGA